MGEQTTLTSTQLFVIYVATMIGSGILTLPRDVAGPAQENGWISVIIGGLLMLVSTLLAMDTARRFPAQTLDQYIKTILGSRIGQLVLLYLAFYFLVSAAIDTRQFSALVKIFLLDQTPVEVIIWVILFSSYMVIRHGMQTMINFKEALFLPTKLILFMLFSMTLTSVHMEDLQPVANNWGGIVKVVPVTVYSYSGPVMIAGFVYALLRRPEKAFTWTIAAKITVILFYTFITIIVVGVFTAPELHYILYPTALVLRAVEFEGGFLERLDAFFTIVYIPINFTTVIVLHYFAAFIVTRMANLEEQRPIALFTVPIIGAIALFFPDAPRFYKMIELVGKTVFFFAIVAIPAIWLIARLRSSRK